MDSNSRIVMWDKPKGRVKGGEYIEIIREEERYHTSPQPYSVPDLQFFRYGVNNSSIVNFNNKTSSIQMWIKAEDPSSSNTTGLYQMAVVTFYREANYQGPTLTCSEMIVDNQYSQWGYFESDNFDNKASSLTNIFH